MEFSLLGALSVRADGEELAVRGAKPRALLALLLLHANHVVAADRLVEDLWEGEPPETAASTLQSHVYNLRRALGRDRLQTRGGGYVLEVAEGELDAAAFEAELTAARTAVGRGDATDAVTVLGRALARWRGPALGEFAGASWALAEAARLEEARVVAVETLLEARLALGQCAEVVASAEAAVAEHPLRERLWGLLMTALYRDGRQAEALRAYQRVRNHLGDELGIEPSADLRDLERRILDQDPAIGGPQPAAAAAPVVSPAPALPSGVVTFLLTDVVGSTRLWDTHPEAMAQALARHDSIVRGAVGNTYGGVLLKARGEGDSTFSVFARATDAIAAARAVQRGMANEAWPPGAVLEIRMALHTGEALEREGDYYGPAVNRVARLRAVAEGGQILVSRSTAEVVVDHLPHDCQLVELGPQELQDLSRPETVYLLSTPVDHDAVRQGERAAMAPAHVPLPAGLAGAPFAGFHGRVGERELFDQRIKEVAEGGHRLLLVAGEPGIGKTALVSEMAQVAYNEGGGATILYGRCDEDVAVPYRPWVEAIGHLVSHFDIAVIDGLGSRRLADLARLVPEVGERVPNLVAPTRGDPEAERYLLFGAVVALLQAASTDRPVVLVLDDLHWADIPTLSLLRHFIAVPEPMHVLVLATYRHSDVSAEHPLADVLAALRRQVTVERLNLGGLGDDELVAIVEAAAGQELDGAELGLVHAVHRETDGNPFFAWELIRHLSESGVVSLSEGGRWLVSGDVDESSLPDSVREVIGRRVARLGSAVKPVLATAAVIGREFDLDVLAAALGDAPEAVLEALEQAEAAQLLMSVARGRFMFSHALVPHTLYQDLNPTRRSQIHRNVAEAIERVDDTGARVAELARHWTEATTPSESDRAIEYARRAGDESLRALAPDEALRWYRQALDLLGRQQQADEAVRCELLIGLGDAQRQVGDPTFRQTVLEASDLARRLGDTERLVRAALISSRGFVLAGQLDQERIDMLETALAALGVADSPDRARLLAALGEELIFGDGSRRKLVAEEALAVARRVGDSETMLDVIPRWFLAIRGLMTPELLQQCVGVTAEGMALAEKSANPVAAYMAMYVHRYAALDAGLRDEAEDCLRRAASLAEEVGQPFLMWSALVSRGTHAFISGDIEAAERLAGEAFELAQTTGQPDAINRYGAALLMIRWHQGREAELVELIHQVVANAPALPMARAGLALVLVAAGRGDEVELDVREIDALPRDAALIPGLALWADVAVRLRNEAVAAVLYERLLPFPTSLGWGEPLFLGATAHYLGMLATVLGRYTEAESHFAQAAETHDRLGAPFLLARTHLEWGRLRLERRGAGDVERGVALVERARDTARQFGCGGVERDATALLESPAGQPDPPALPPRLAALVPPVLVGREADLRELAGSLEAAVGGERRVVLLAGEPGVGKTSLAAHLAKDARIGGATVLYGRCDEDIGLPYQPWIEALGHLIGDAPDAVLDAIGERRLGDLGRVVPDVRERLPHLAPVERGDPETDRYLFYRAAAAALEGAAARGPVVVVLDDLHWADIGSLALLRQVVGGLAAARLLIVTTYRQSELSADSPLSDTLALLRREQGVDRVTLRGVDERDLVGFMEAAAGHALDANGRALAHAVHRETDGNPFFAGEILRHLAETGAFTRRADGRWEATGDFDEADLPESVREVVARRVRRLGDDVHDALRTAAVIGREFDLDVLHAALGIGEDEALAVCDRAEAAALVTSVTRGRFTFNHALIPHTLYQELNPARRAHLHARVAEAIEHVGAATDRVAELARHWGEATDAGAGRGIDYARRAGEQALSALAPDEAVRWYAQALTLLDERGAPDDHLRCELLIGLGDAQRQVADPSHRETLLAAAALARELDDTERLVRAALVSERFGGTMISIVDADRIEVVEAALAAIDPDDSSDRARLLVALSLQLHFRDFARARSLADEALAVARRLDDPTTLVEVMNRWTLVLMVPETLEERLAVTAEAVALADSLGDPFAVWAATQSRFFAALEAARSDEAQRCVERQRALAEEIRQPTLRFLAAVLPVPLCLYAGEFDEAERLVAEVYELGQATHQPDALIFYGAQLLWVRWHQGREAELVDLIIEAAEGAPDVPSLKIAIPWLLVAAGRGDEVTIDLDDLDELPYDSAWHVGMNVWAEIASRLRAVEAAQTMFERLAPYATYVADTTTFGTGAVAHYLGLLATVLERYDDAESYFAQAEGIHERVGSPFYLARTHLEWGRMLLERRGSGDVERGVALVERALARARRHGCAGVERDALALLESGVAQRAPVGESASQQPSNLPAERSSFVGREEEMRMVADIVRSARVVTLTGVGGVGKTRLAIQAAASLGSEFPDGVWLAELAPLIDASLVATTVASAVGAPLSPGVDGADVVCRFLTERRALLVLDNCEHVIDLAAALVDQLVRDAPNVTVLVTSREPLGVVGESVWRVPSLTVQAGEGLGDAVALFAERAAHARPGFVLNDTTTDAVMAVCQRLDGIPLAIELAAARTKVMSVEQIAAHLDERFRLLTRGGRTAVPRQQTLQGAIDWSYELLGPAEREFFDALGVFAGAFELGAAAGVGEQDELEALDLIQSLVDRSMLEVDASRDRYRLLETLRQYAWDRLVATGRLQVIRDRHASWFMAVAGEQASRMSRSGQQVDALDRLEADYDNLRAALAHLIEAGHAQAAVRMARRLIGLFNIRHPAEGYGWFQQIVAISDDLPAKTRARLLADTAYAAMTVGDGQAQLELAQAAVEAGGDDAPAIALWLLSQWHTNLGEIEVGIERARSAVAAATEAGDDTTQVVAMGQLLHALGAAGDEAEVRQLVPEVIALAEQLGNPTITASSRLSAAGSLAFLGSPREAVDVLAQGLDEADAGGPIIASSTRSLYAFLLDDAVTAARAVQPAIAMARERLTGSHQLPPLLSAAKILTTAGKHVAAARLVGSYEHHGHVWEGSRKVAFNSATWSFLAAMTVGAPWTMAGSVALPPHSEYTRLTDQLRSAMGAESLRDELERGAHLSTGEALQLAEEALAEML